MTTEKALRKILETVHLNHDKCLDDIDEDILKNTFASNFYPRLYKRKPMKAISKAMIDIDVCESLKYIELDDTADTLGEWISLTERGSQRIESKADSIRNLFVKALIALGGAAGTVACSFIIQLIQSHI